MRFKRVSASVKTAFAFSLVWGHNACVSHSCLHLLRRLLRFLRMMLQCIRFKCVCASVKTVFALSFVLRYNILVSLACLHRLRRLLRFSSYRVTMYACLHLLRRLLRFLCIALQCMRFTRVSVSIMTAFAFSLYRVTMHAFHTRVWNRFKRLFAFFFVLRYNVCVSNACLHQLRRFLRFPLYGVTIHAFHTQVCIDCDGFCVFLRMALQYMRFTRVSASTKTVFAFFFVWRQSTCVSNACLHL